MATKLKVVEAVADIVPAPTIPESQGPHGSTTSVGLDFAPAPTRKRNAGWTAERQRKFMEHLALTGHVGEACPAKPSPVSVAEATRGKRIVMFGLLVMSVVRPS